MPESVQITVAVCLTIIVLAILFVTMVWIGAKYKQNNQNK